MSNDKRFDVQVGLIRALAELGAEDSQKIESLERELDCALRTISYFVARFGEPSQSDPKSLVVRGNAFEILDSPYTLVRWDDPATEDICFGVRIDEH